ncbi:MAG TPA: hypothetical protein VFO53_06070 [Casimicrobiaceae bacterium]|nr:hypothetical protein [Casimicrobiaceae bacterium]
MHSRAWHACIAWCALVAVAWPSLGPLPFLVHDFVPHVHRDGGHANAGDGDHFDASSIPGSPTHPVDHDCPECEVLKHLSRCVLPMLAVAIVAPVVVSVVTQRVAVARPPAQIVAHLPPARAPPRSLA